MSVEETSTALQDVTQINSADIDGIELILECELHNDESCNNLKDNRKRML